LKQILEEEDKEKELLDVERGASSSKSAKLNTKKRGMQGSPGESSKRKKTKPKASTSTESVAKEPEKILDSPAPSTSKGSSDSGENVEGFGRLTRARTRSQKK